MEILNVREQQVFEFIKSSINEKGYPPTVREICAATGLKSTCSAQIYINKLIEKGYIEKSGFKNRTLKVIEGEENKEETIAVPVVGKVAAGEPILAVENIEDYFTIGQSFFSSSALKNDNFVLRVQGESMINVGINNGDFIVVSKQNTAKNGEIVVALIENEATVKTFYKEDGHIRLQPENDTMEPIIVKQADIIGKVIGLFRKIG